MEYTGDDAQRGTERDFPVQSDVYISGDLLKSSGEARKEFILNMEKVKKSANFGKKYCVFGDDMLY